MDTSSASPPGPAPGLQLLDAPGGGTEALLDGGSRRLRLSADARWLLEHLDGRISYAELADLLSARTGRAVGAAQARELVERVLVAPGLTRARAGARVARGRLVPILPAAATARLARLLSPLASAWGMPVSALAAVTTLAWFAGPSALRLGTWLDLGAWLFAPVAVAVSLLVHELLHAAALSAAGGRPGAISFISGRGLHLRADLPGLAELPRWARVRVDLAGAHGQLLFAALLAVAAAWAALAPPLPAILLVMLSAAGNLAPFEGRDGGYLVDDLAGRPQGASRVRPVPFPRWAAAAIRLTAADLAIRLGIGRLARLRRLIVVMVATSFPDRSPAWRRAFTRRHLAATAHLALDMKDVGRGRGADVVRHREPLRALLRQRRGVVVCSIHMGPFPFVPLTLAEEGATVMLYATPDMQRQGHAMWEASAERIGATFEVLSPTSVRDAARALRGLREGRVLSILMDGQHSANRDVHRTDLAFLGADFCMRTGPVVLAARARAPIVLAATWWRGAAQRVLEFSDAFEPPHSEDEVGIVACTRELYRWFEPRVASRAHQWNGWTWPIQHWRESGRAPTATRADLERAQARALRALNGEARGARLLADDTLCATYGEPPHLLLVQGDARRVMRGSPESAGLLEAAFRSPRAAELPRRLGAPAEALAPELARLVLAGMVRLEDGSAR